MSYDLRLVEHDEADGGPLWRAAAEGTQRVPASEAPLPPEARRLLALRNGVPVARLAFGAREAFAGAAGATGYVGWYAARDGEAGLRLLNEAAERLFSDRAQRVIGPLDGSTWYRYRAALPRERQIEGGGPFLSEPLNPPEWAEQFEGAGFRPLLEYETRRVSAPRADPDLESHRAELTNRGVRLRSLDLAAYPAELRALHQLSLEAFAENPFYTPISFAGFEQLYGPLRPLIDPALVRVADDTEGRVVAYVFAFPDALAPAASPRIVLKTLAVRRELRGARLGAILVDEIHRAAAARGASVLHALMQVTNASRRISAHSESELFRRYVLYGVGQR